MSALLATTTAVLTWVSARLDRDPNGGGGSLGSAVDLSGVFSNRRGILRRVRDGGFGRDTPHGDPPRGRNLGEARARPGSTVGGRHGGGHLPSPRSRIVGDETKALAVRR